MRPEVLAEPLTQFFENAACPLHVDFARHLDGGVVAVIAPAQRPAERIGLLLGTRLAETAGLAGAHTHAHHALLLHLLGEVLSAAPQRIERAALRADGAVRIALAELAFGLPHGVAGLAELIARP